MALAASSDNGTARRRITRLFFYLKNPRGG
jgi:hypothetical protein